MSDISNVLRKVIELDISLGLDGTQEALDEITRLTAEVEKLNSELTDALTDLATARQDNASFMPILNRLTAENEKLRAALERIADTDPDEGTQWFHEVATAALAGDKHE